MKQKKIIIFVVLICITAGLVYNIKNKGNIKNISSKVSVTVNDTAEIKQNTKKINKDNDNLFNQAFMLFSENKLNEAENLYKKFIAEHPNHKKVPDAWEAIAKIYEKKGMLLDAKKVYNKLIEKYSNSINIEDIQKKSGNLNIRLLFSPVMTEKSFVYEVMPGDNLSKIGDKYNNTVALIMRSNNLENTLIKPGMKLKINTARFSLIIDKSQNKLTLKADDQIIKVYDIATGKDNSTPEGTFKIINKLKDPVWYKTGAIVSADSPENELGTRWMGISKPGYGIHGTIKPESIGKQLTQGCIRMNNNDVEELYDLLTIGTEVTIVE